MNHSEASHLMASEKYLLDELSPDEAQAFEEHLFGCHECAMDVRAGSLFLEQSKLALANPAARHIPAEGRESSGWFAWLRPAFAVAALAVLLLLAGYQNLVTFPALKGALAENKTPKILPATSLISDASRGPGDLPAVITVRAGKPFLLPLDIPAKNTFESYVVELQNPAGSVEWSLPVSTEASKNTLPIQSPGVDQAGKYELVVTGLNAQGGKVSEVGHYAFELQFARAANPEP